MVGASTYCHHYSAVESGYAGPESGRSLVITVRRCLVGRPLLRGSAMAPFESKVARTWCDTGSHWMPLMLSLGSLVPNLTRTVPPSPVAG